MKSTLLVLLVVSVASSSGLACINNGKGFSEVPTKPKLPPMAPHALSVPIVPGDAPSIGLPALPLAPLPLVSAGPSPELRAASEKIIRVFEASDRAKAAVEDATDYAAALIYIGRYADAIRELQQVEKRSPGSYVTASALGTAYELTGELKKAREWIARGIARDAHGHGGTEWLHLDIIDAKRRLERNPGWLAQNPTIQHRAAKEPAQIMRAIEHQLNERMNFVSGEDAIVSDLFYEAGLLSEGFFRRDYYFRQSLRFGKIREKEIERARAAS